MKKIIKEEYLRPDRDICGVGELTKNYLVTYDDETSEIEYREPKSEPITFETIKALLG